MNGNILTVLKQITAQKGEEVLNDARRLKSLFGDLAKDEPKPLRSAFVCCIEEGAYNALKDAPHAAERSSRKASIAQRVRNEHGIDPAFCAEALDILEAVLFGEGGIAPSTPAPAGRTPQSMPQPQPSKKKPKRSRSVLCKSCGTALQEGWKMCPHCGAASPALPSPQPVPLPGQPRILCKSCGKALQEGWKACPLCGAASPALPSPQPMPPQVQPPLAAVQVTPSEPAGFVQINGGTFTMGSPADEPERYDNEVQHQVTVQGFYMGKYEVTQREWREVMGTNPSYFKGDNLPVERVSWYEAVEYCNQWNRREGLTPAYRINEMNVSWNRNASGCRLPTEAEWEYACRAGTSGPYNTGNNITASQANYDVTYREMTVNAGSFAPNAWGLYDMHGNVWEWCWDWYGNYPNRAQSDPVGPSAGANRVARGGSWYGLALNLRSAYRISFTPAFRIIDVGFRLVRP